jgi:F-type H+-transporting ATPase subunit b
MLIDWFTVGAQVLNFLILVWLMKRFLYKPILNAIDAREHRIAAELADADAKKAEAKQERDEFHTKNQAFEEQRDSLLTQAKDQAQAERERLLEEARKAADALSDKRHESLMNEARTLNQAITRRTQDEVFAIARKTLADLATISLEERMGDVFLRRLRELNTESRQRLAASLMSASEPARVRSAFDLPTDLRAAIQQALNETFSTDIRLRFETAPNLVSGMELITNGHKVAWSIADYLASLETGVGDILQAQSKTHSTSKKKPEPKVEKATSVDSDP